MSDQKSQKFEAQLVGRRVVIQSLDWQRTLTGQLVNEGNGGFFRRGHRLRHRIGVAAGYKGKFFADLIRRNPGVGPVAKRCAGGLFALAEEGLSVFFGNKGFRHKTRSLVRSVAEGLVGGLAAGAEVVLFPSL